MSLPLSSFAQTVLEEEEKFYATFPEARQTAIELQWRYHHKVSHSQYVEGTGSQYCPEDGSYAALAHSYHDSDHLLGVHSYPETRPLLPDLSSPFNNYSFVTEEPTLGASASPQPILYGWDKSQSSGTEEVLPNEHYLTRTQGQPASTLCSSAMSPTSCGHPVVPSHQPLIDRGLIRAPVISPIEDHLDHFSSFDSIGLTGSWKTDAAAANEHMLHAPAPLAPDVSSLDDSVTKPSKESSQLAHSPRKTRRSQSHPYISARADSRPPSRTRLSGPPIKSRPRKAVHSKPPLACLFCRGRKIACRAPPAGSERRTCNQCDKRGLCCVFPLESYRGVRNKQSNRCEMLALNQLNTL